MQPRRSLILPASHAAASSPLHLFASSFRFPSGISAHQVIRSDFICAHQVLGRKTLSGAAARRGSARRRSMQRRGLELTWGRGLRRCAGSFSCNIEEYCLRKHIRNKILKGQMFFSKRMSFSASVFYWNNNAEEITVTPEPPAWRNRCK